MIMAKENKYLMEQELMEAFTYAEDAKIGMPDIEAELLKVRKNAAKHTKSSSGFTRIASVAASVVVVLALVWSVKSYISLPQNSHNGNNKNFCVAYVAGERITNEQEVLNLIEENITNMNSEDDIIDCQLSDFFKD